MKRTLNKEQDRMKDLVKLVETLGGEVNKYEGIYGGAGGKGGDEKNEAGAAAGGGSDGETGGEKGGASSSPSPLPSALRLPLRTEAVTAKDHGQRAGLGQGVVDID